MPCIHLQRTLKRPYAYSCFSQVQSGPGRPFANSTGVISVDVQYELGISPRLYFNGPTLISLSENIYLACLFMILGLTFLITITASIQ